MTIAFAGRAPAGRFDVRQNHEMNVTPFIDIMLVLLIVFIIAAPLATTAIPLDIAAGHGFDVVSPAGVLIDEHGGLSISSAKGTVPTSLEKLGRDLTNTTGADGPRSWVVVSGAAHTRYGAFMAVMDRLHADGYANVSLAAKRL